MSIFSIFSYQFMRTAFLATLLITPLFALLGTMAVNAKMAFFSDALGHSALTGIALGVLLGMKNPLFSMLAFGIILGLIIGAIKKKNVASTDTVISVCASTALALGIVILSKHGGFAKYSSYLIGDILTVNPGQIAAIAVVLGICYFIWFFLYNDLLLLSIHPSLAASRGVPIDFIENVFIVMLAVSVMLTIQWVGILTINSLLILPAAAARNIAVNARQYHVISTIFSLTSGVLGLYTSYLLDTSAGASMVLFAAGFFFLTFAVRVIRHS